MSENKLGFILGLATGQFLSKMAESVGAVKGLIAATLGVGGLKEAFEKTWGAIERGSALQVLSRQTGESVSNLFQLQKGLGAVGLSADDLGGMLFHMQKALGGVNEAGMPTGHIFAQMGLSMQALQQMGAPEAIETIAAAMQSLGQSSAAAAAGEIFGREGARNFLTLAHSTGEFAAALERSKSAAAQMAHDAGVFRMLKEGADQIKGKLDTLWVGIAEGAAPAIKMIEDAFKKVDWQGIGETIGNTVLAFTEAFREGKLATLIAETFKFGFNAVIDMAPAIFMKLGYIIFKALETPLNYVQASITTVAAKAMLIAGGHFDLAKEVKFADVFREQQKEGPTFATLFGNVKIEDLNDASNAAMKAGLANLGKDWNDYAALLKKFQKNGQKLFGGLGEDDDGGGGGGGAILGGAYRREFNGLEKMGYAFRSGGGLDHASETARNTRDTVAAIKELTQKVAENRDKYFGNGFPAPFLTNSHAS